MSLLLQALQKASKSRESAPQPVGGPSGGAMSRGLAGALELEPGEIEPSGGPPTDFDALTPKAPERAPEPGPAEERIEEFATARPAQAATVLSAAGGGVKQASRASVALDWARDHPVHVFAGLALAFLLAYGAYVYVAVTNPALFTGTSPGGGPNRNTGPLAKGPQPTPATTAPTTTGANSDLLLDDIAPGAPQGAPATAAVVAADRAAGDTRTVADAGPAAGSAEVSAPAAPARETVPADAGARLPTKPQESSGGTAPPTQSPVAKPTTVLRDPGTGGATAAGMSRPAAGDTISARPAGTPRKAPSKRARAGTSADAEDGALRIRTTDLASKVAAYLNEGYEAFQSGRVDEASQAYGRALSTDATNTDAMIGLAAIAWHEGRPEAASEYYYRVLQLDPQNAQAQAGLIGLMGHVDPVSAESRLKQLIAREPSDVLYFTLGNLHAGQRQWAPAQQAYFQAHQLDPTNPDYAYNLAIGLEHLGQPRLALGYYRKAMELARTRGRSGFDPRQVSTRIDRLSVALER